MLLTHALALSANQFLCKKNPYEFARALGENLAHGIDFGRHGDNLPSHQGRRLWRGNALININTRLIEPLIT